MKVAKTRGNYDKRTKRIIDGEINRQAIASYRIKNISTFPEEEEDPIDSEDLPKFSVFIRKRPIFKHETQKGDFDVLSCQPNKNELIVHQCNVRRDNNPLNGYLSNYHFKGYSNVYSETSNNEEIYLSSTYPLIEYVTSEEGRDGVVFFFGQTGSGKTYTCSSLLEKSMKDLFFWCEDNPELSLYLSVVEMSGNYCFDLMNRRKKVSLRDDGTGVSKMRGVMEKKPKSLGDCKRILQKSFSNRKTRTTNINSVSSRTHCIVSFITKIKDENNFQNNFQNNESEFCRMTFIDLAGSERNADSLFHKGERITETISINKSINALKDCIRSYNEGNSFIPFRADSLTRKLRACFLPGSMTKTVIICTVSPGSIDTEHTLNTLRYSNLMAPDGENKNENIDFKRYFNNNSCRKPLMKKKKRNLNVNNINNFKKNRNNNKKKKNENFNFKDFGKTDWERRKGIVNSKKVNKRFRNCEVHPKFWDIRTTKSWLTHVIRDKEYLRNFPTHINGAMIVKFSKKRFAQYCGNNIFLGDNIRTELLKLMKKNYD